MFLYSWLLLKNSFNPKCLETISCKTKLVLTKKKWGGGRRKECENIRLDFLAYVSVFVCTGCDGVEFFSDCRCSLDSQEER